MPGSSLWLVPLDSSPLSKTLTTLITSIVPAIYPIAIPARFSPHVTLTADTVGSSSSDPQEWLDNLDLPESVAKLKVQIKEPQVGEIFFRKLTLRCEKNAELKSLAGTCRFHGSKEWEEQINTWMEEVYAPHLSLLYSELPQDEVNSKMDEVKAAIEKAKNDNSDPLSAKGAEIWLVPTHRGIDDWQPIARRKLEGVEWSWES